MVNDPAKIPALTGFAAQAQAAGAKDLAINLLWRAAQHCWWSNAGSAVRAGILAAASRLELPEADPRLVAIAAYAEPLHRGGDISVELQKLSGKKSGDPAVARTLGSAANVIGAFDLGVSFLTASSAALREQGRLSDLARVLFAQAWAEMEVGDWMGAMREAEESVRFAEETGGTLWIAAATIVKAKLAGMQGNLNPKRMRRKRNASYCPSEPVSCWRCCRSPEAYPQSARAVTGRPTSTCDDFSLLPILHLTPVFSFLGSQISWRQASTPAMRKPPAA
jgi:hypothetical protein